MLLFLGAEAVGEVIVTAAVLVLGDRSIGVLHHRLPYHLGEDSYSLSFMSQLSVGQYSSESKKSATCIVLMP